MDFKYKNVKKLDFKRWLLSGNSKIYAIILLVTIAAIIVVLTTSSGLSNNNSDNTTNESTSDATKETQFTVAAQDNTGTRYIFPYEKYKIMINKASNFVTVYTMDSSGDYTVVHKQFRCSVNPSVQTQTTSIAYKYSWVVFGRNLCGRFVSKLSSGTYIHSTPYYNQDVYMVNKGAYNNLGNSASLGYIYLSVADSKWIFENCGIDTVIVIYENANEVSPFASIPLEPATTKYDPTDIEAANNYVPETKAPETRAPETKQASESADDEAQTGSEKSEVSETKASEAEASNNSADNESQTGSDEALQHLQQSGINRP